MGCHNKDIKHRWRKGTDGPSVEALTSSAQAESKELMLHLRGTILLVIVHKNPELKVQVRAGDSSSWQIVVKTTDLLQNGVGLREKEKANLDPLKTSDIGVSGSHKEETLKKLRMWSTVKH